MKKLNISVENSLKSPNFGTAFKFVDSGLHLSSRIGSAGADKLYKDVKKAIDTNMSWYYENVLYAITKKSNDTEAIEKLKQLGVKHLYIDNEDVQKMSKNGARLEPIKVVKMFEA